MSIVSNLPACTGVGFKPVHFRDILAAPQPLGFFEVHAENYMGAGGPPHAQLGALRERYALSVHGVGLSIGSMGPLDRDHLVRLKTLCDRYAPESFSNISPGRRTAACTSTTYCRSPIRSRRWRGSPSISTRHRRRLDARCCSK